MSVIRTVPCIILAFVASTAFAHKGMHGPGAKFDADGNGVLSLQEYTAYLKAGNLDVAAAASLFAKSDLDKSGGLSAAEITVGLPKSSPASTNR